jgi:rhodanese-related sulfurtransferase
MRKLILLLLIILMLVSCRTKPVFVNVNSLEDIIASHPGGYVKITPREALNIMELAEKENLYETGKVVILDVRSPDEYASGHLKKAVNLPNETIADELPAILPDLGNVLLVYCRSGARSHEAATKLVNLGYRYVFDIGGLADWPYELEKS